jgi:hypothetical protein
MDVVGLYPHIPHEEGLEALEKVMRKSDGELPVEKLVSLARVVLENNYFEFDEKLFCQKLGMGTMAVGTMFALGYANILEEFLDSCELMPWIWWRFLADVFMIWLHGKKELNDFLAQLNSFRESIKFTWESSSDGISFLDGAFQTDMFSKPTDAHQYLNFKSCHAPHIKCICSDEINLGIWIKKVMIWVSWGDFSRVKGITRTSLLTRKESSETN